MLGMSGIPTTLVSNHVPIFRGTEIDISQTTSRALLSLKVTLS